MVASAKSMLQKATTTAMRTEYLWTREEKIEMWGEGPWLDEPDLVEWLHEGFPCFILRHDELGTLNGYVGVTPEHPWYGKDLTSSEVESPGGITFAGKMQVKPEYMPSSEFQPCWYLGFDTVHAFDLVPFMRKLAYDRGRPVMPVLLAPISRPDGVREEAESGPAWVDTYKHFRWVRAETERVAEQARDAVKKLLS